MARRSGKQRGSVGEHIEVVIEKWYTPRQVATSRQVSPAKVLQWIRSGELEASNYAQQGSVRPRWRISSSALRRFDLVRCNRAASPEGRRARAASLDGPF